MPRVRYGTAERRFYRITSTLSLLLMWAFMLTDMSLGIIGYAADVKDGYKPFRYACISLAVLTGWIHTLLPDS